MMEDYKLNINWLLVPELYRCIGTTRSGKHFDLTLPVGIDNIIDVMEKTVPGSREPMKVFFDLAKECVDAHDYFSDHIFDKFDKNDMVKVDSMLYLKRFPNFLRLAERPFNAVLRKIGMPEDAIDILNVYWTYIGMDYERLSSYIRRGCSICTQRNARQFANTTRTA